jgi:hypothetical protein
MKRHDALTQMTRLSHGVFRAHLLGADDLAACGRAALAGDLQAAAVMMHVCKWLEYAATAKPGTGPQCLTCRTELVGQPPFAFAMIGAFAHPCASLSGICAHCALTLPCVESAMFAAWREIWPDLRLAEGGHA